MGGAQHANEPLESRHSKGNCLSMDIAMDIACMAPGGQWNHQKTKNNVCVESQRRTWAWRPSTAGWKKVVAMPRAPARPVRPMRCT